MGLKKMYAFIFSCMWFLEIYTAVIVILHGVPGGASIGSFFLWYTVSLFIFAIVLPGLVLLGVAVEGMLHINAESAVSFFRSVIIMSVATFFVFSFFAWLLFGVFAPWFGLFDTAEGILMVWFIASCYTGLQITFNRNLMSCG